MWAELKRPSRSYPFGDQAEVSYKKKIVRAAVSRAWLASLDRPLPPHIKARPAGQSSLIKSLHNEGYSNWKGLSSVNGEMGLHPKHGTGGNNLRQKKSREWAREMERKYPDHFWKRGGATVIAKLEDVHPSTVRSAKRKLKQNEQAK